MARGWRRSLAALIALALVVVARTAGAANDPRLILWTIETKHLRIHYEKRLEPVAIHVARLGESVHDRLIGPMGYEPSTRTEVVLTDNTDSANGSATALPLNVIRLFVTAPEDLSPLSDYEDWQLGLITHEYVHVLHTDNISGVASVVNAIIGKVLAPNQIQPRWILEGWATAAETDYTSGGRVRSSIWEMYLRADVIENNIAGLDQISSNSRRWPQGTLWYLYGSHFLTWIQEVYGKNTMRAVSADYGASLAPWGLNRAIRRVTGRTYTELYEGFKEHIKRRYARELKVVHKRGLREGRRITFDGRQAHYPRFLPKKLRSGKAPYELLYYRDNFDTRPGLYRVVVPKALAKSEKAKFKRPTPRLFARTNQQSPASWTRTGELLLASVAPYRTVWRRTDLFRLPAGKGAPGGEEHDRTRLTHGLRVRAPHARGRQVVFTRNNQGTTFLEMAEIDDDGELSNRRELIPSKPFDQRFTPMISPDGRSVAFSSWSRGGYRDIQVVDIATRKVTSVTRDRSLDTGPCWSPDGRKLYFVSDRTGINNVHVWDVATKTIKQVTNVRTGAFMPSVSEDGKLLAYVGYTAKGWDLYVMRLDASRFLPAVKPPNDRPAPLASPANVPMVIKRYEPWKTLRPFTYSFDLAPGPFGEQVLTIGTTASDVAGQHSLGLTVIGDGGAPIPQATIDYAYRWLPVDLSMRLANRVRPRRDYSINGEQQRYTERSFAVRAGASYNQALEFGNQRIAVSYLAQVLDQDLPIGNDVNTLDPLAPPTRLPDSGLISSLNFGYTLGRVEGQFDGVGARRGMVVRLGLTIADEFLGSTESLLSADYFVVGYVPMPWPGKHTLALRSAGAMATGTYSRQGIFGVGGFNLDNLSPLDALTSTAFNGAFALRGYPAGSYSGANYLLNTMEYRLPIAEIDRGISTLPVYLQRINGNLFLDHGGAWNKFRFDEVEFFSKGAIIHSNQLHTSVGAEIWTEMSLGYQLNFNFRLGYAYGIDRSRIPGGQPYFIASGAF